MVSQQLLISPLLPRALLPASSLEPLEADERVLCSFERIAVAAGGPDADASAAEEGNADAVAVGTLHITSRRLVWLPSENINISSISGIQAGFQAGFASIVMHALQGGSSGGGGGSEAENKSNNQAPAVYLQLDDDGDDDADETAFRGTGEIDGDAEGGEGGGKDPPSSTPCPPNDLRLVPLPADRSSSSSPSSIAREIFSAMCEAAAMNPTAGEGEGIGDEEDDGDWFYDEQVVAEGLSAATSASRGEGAAAAAAAASPAADRLARYDALLQMPRARDLDELLDDEEELGEEEGFEEEEEEESGGDDDNGRLDDPEPETTTTA